MTSLRLDLIGEHLPVGLFSFSPLGLILFEDVVELRSLNSDLWSWEIRNMISHVMRSQPPQINLLNFTFL